MLQNAKQIEKKKETASIDHKIWMIFVSQNNESKYLISRKKKKKK